MELISSGRLQVRTYVADEAVPVQGSIVRISGAGENNRTVIYSVETDEDGVTPSVSLPTPDKIYSMSSGSAESAYSIYDVVISKEGFYTKTVRDVAIFADVEAVLPVNMIPYVSYADGGSYPRGNINAIVKENERLES